MTDNSGKLELILKNELYASWMTVNNCFPDWPIAQRGNKEKRFWNGLLFQLNKNYLSFQDNLLSNNPGYIVLKYAGGGEDTITAAELEAGDWVYVKIAQEGRDDPMKDYSQARMCFHGTLHHKIEPYPGGIIVWDSREQPFSMTAMPIGAPGFQNQYVFSFNTGAGFEVHIMDAAYQVKDSPNGVNTIEIHGGAGGPKDVLNPPQYP